MDLTKIFMFNMDCGDRGFIIADSVNEAVQKLERHKKVKIRKDDNTEYSYESKEGIFDLWIWGIYEGDVFGDVVITETW